MEHESVRASAPSTGDPAVDAALRELQDLDDRPLRDHVTVVDTAAAALAERLSEPAG